MGASDNTPAIATTVPPRRRAPRPMIRRTISWNGHSDRQIRCVATLQLGAPSWCTHPNDAVGDARDAGERVHRAGGHRHLDAGNRVLRADEVVARGAGKGDTDPVNSTPDKYASRSLNASDRSFVPRKDRYLLPSVSTNTVAEKPFPRGSTNWVTTVKLASTRLARWRVSSSASFVARSGSCGARPAT